MKIYITRHSKTIWNQEKRLQGRKDSPLTQEGIENAYALKDYISDISFDKVYTSPILRAKKTCEIICGNNDYIEDDRLMEMNFGDFEGKRIVDILKDDAEIYNDLWKRPECFTRIDHGESYDEVKDRAVSFLDDLIKQSYENVLIVTHGMYFVVLLATILGLDKKDYIKINQPVVEGCSLTCVDYSHGKYTLEFYNQGDYLPHRSHTDFTQG